MAAKTVTVNCILDVMIEIGFVCSECDSNTDKMEGMRIPRIQIQMHIII
jgi:hypothetical protein